MSFFLNMHLHCFCFYLLPNKCNTPIYYKNIPRRSKQSTVLYYHFLHTLRNPNNFSMRFNKNYLKLKNWGLSSWTRSRSQSWWSCCLRLAISLFIMAPMPLSLSSSVRMKKSLISPISEMKHQKQSASAVSLGLKSKLLGSL